MINWPTPYSMLLEAQGIFLRLLSSHSSVWGGGNDRDSQHSRDTSYPPLGIAALVPASYHEGHKGSLKG